MSDSTSDTTVSPQPLAVPLPEAQRLLGGKSVSQIYVEAGRGRLDLRRDGHKTLVTTASIAAYMSELPVAPIKKYPPAADLKKPTNTPWAAPRRRARRKR